MSGIRVDFTWTPVSVNLAYTIRGNNYPPITQADGINRSAQVGSLDSRYVAHTTPSNTNLTFTASTNFPAGIAATEYRWEWGDGQVGYGPEAVHNYPLAIQELAAKLTVSDSNGDVWNTSKVLGLRFAQQIIVHVNTVPVVT